MHTSKLATLLLLAALFLVNVGARAGAAGALDPPAPSDETLLAQLMRSGGASTRVLRHAATGKLRFVAMPPGRPLAQGAGLAGTSPELAARAFLATYGQLFGVRDQARELRVLRQTTLRRRSFVRFQQVAGGVPILGGELVVQTDERRAVVSANGEALPDPPLVLQPSIPGDAAARVALAEIARARGMRAADLRASPPELWIYNPALLGGPGPRVSRLVWRMDVRAGNAAPPVRELVLVDALGGDVALHFDQIADAKQRAVCNNHNQVNAPACAPARYVRVEGQPPAGDTDVDLAYDYAGITYDYYFSHFGRDSLDGNGLPLVSVVKYCPDAKHCPEQNAGWDGEQMIYGAGFAAADDVVGHELTHGFTQYTSNLFYYYQAGAINESLSDVFGELIDQVDGRGDDSPGVRWLLGEDLPASFGVVRNMADPGSLPLGIPGPYFTVSPDRMTSPNYVQGLDDNGGVHTNSGVNNKAAFLMTDGGSFNGYTIAGLGAAKVAAIYYTLDLAFLTSASDYQDLYADLPAACATLAASGSYGLTAGDCAQVQKVVGATEMDQQPLVALAPDAPICPAGQTSQDLFYDDLENTTSGNWSAAALQGQDGWHYPYGAAGPYATSGTQALWGADLGGPAPADYAIAMTHDVVVPPNAHMHFRHAFDFDAGTQGSRDGGVVEYSADGGQIWSDTGPLFTDNGYDAAIDGASANPLAGRPVFGGSSNGYTSSRLNLTSLAGQSVRFRFRIGVDASNPGDSYAGWYIDDIRLYTCGSAPPAVSWRATSATATEGDSAVTLEVALSGARDTGVTVPIGAGGTAAAGVDYRSLTGTAIIPAGAASARVVLRINSDLVKEGDETIVLTLGAPANATLGAPTVATITVKDVPPRGVYVPLVAN